MNIKMWGAGFIMACLLSLTGTVQAANEYYDFTISGGWFDCCGNPYGMSNSPTLDGSLSVNNVTDTLTSFSLTTGSEVWTLANVTSSSLSFSNGVLTGFNPINFSDSTTGGSGYIYSNNTFGVSDGSFYNACNNCVSFALSRNIAPVPEPSTYAMLLAGLGLIGFILYRRKDDSSDMPMAA